MTSYAAAQIGENKERPILLDTNLALLYLVGSFDVGLVSSHKRTSTYTADDFEKLSKLVERCGIPATTPHVLAEISNLIGRNLALRRVFGSFIALSEEIFESAKSLAGISSFSHLGITDVAILSAARDGYLIVTDDGPLQQFLSDQRLAFLNLDHIRMI